MSTQLNIHAKKIYHQLSTLEKDLGEFLNNKSVHMIIKNDLNLDKEYVMAIVKHLRFLEVYCTEGKRALERLMVTEEIQEEVLQKIYQGVYQKCIHEFFSPKDDLWHEDSRASYLNKCSIVFQNHPGEDIIEVTHIVEPTFHELREQLDFLEAL
ncbi:DUF3907 family protein [Alkalibacillus aidingensis]|uniref:DUF3907 family protein n=1 Tax=Alkalibacillus aidingensis TaxID=2747607 RepID=UPI0016609E8D|nr:DUF3907 family protein [Alkalibacillus aidingensis]